MTGSAVDADEVNAYLATLGDFLKAGPVTVEHVAPDDATAAESRRTLGSTLRASPKDLRARDTIPPIRQASREPRPMHRTRDSDEGDRAEADNRDSRRDRSRGRTEPRHQATLRAPTGIARSCSISRSSSALRPRVVR